MRKLKLSAEDFRRKYPNALREEPGLQRGAHPRSSGQQCSLLAPGPGGRGELRAADRLRQRGEPAAGARRRAAPRDRDPGSHRRRPRPHHPATADGKRAARTGGRRGRSCTGSGGDPRAAECEYRQPAARRAGGLAGGGRLAGAGVHRSGRRIDGHPVRPDPRAAKLASRFERHPQGERRTVRHRACARTRRGPSWWSAKWRWPWCCWWARPC